MGAVGCKRLGVVLVVVIVIGLGGWGEGCWEQEKLALLQVKPFFHIPPDPFSDTIAYALNDWVEEEGKESSDCCQWERVECDATTGRVIGLDLTGRSMVDNFFGQPDDYKTLNGEGWYLNASLFLPFKELKNIFLSGQQIVGFLDNEGFENLASELEKLEVLDLSWNFFNDSSILSSSVEFSSLKFLNLSYNNLKRQPNKLRGAIEILDLKGNELDDSILVSVSELSSLKYLDLSYNRIQGSIHNKGKVKYFAHFGDISYLKMELYIPMQGGHFVHYLFHALISNALYIVGCIDLKNLIKLKELHLTGNEITSLDSFHGLINLEVLALSLNILNNSILSSLGPFSKCLKHLYIASHSILKGSIDIEDVRDLKNLNGVTANNSVLLQQSLDLFSSLRTILFESDSIINEMVTSQELRNLTNLEELYLSYDSLPSGFDSLPTAHSLEDIGDQLASLRVLSLSARSSLSDSHLIQGVLRLKNLESMKMDSIALEISFLEKIFAMTSLKILSLRRCALFGTLSTQDICQLTRLQELYITDNKLKGVLPGCFSNLTSLQHLDLSSNQFYGNLPISPLQSFTYVDLSYNQFQIPSSLKAFFNHSKLKYFNGDYNNIYKETELHSLAPRFRLNHISLSCCGDVGQLPKFLHYQHELQYVALSNINLTGEFPSWLLENNTELETLFLINNSLSGNFQLPFHPSMKLLELDISSNSINGHIPPEIGVYLPGLVLLNISNNHLDGSIPSSIGDMKSLERLDLSDNRLFGVIPENLATGCSSLELLQLSNNRLQGQIFSANFNLTNLSHLYLAGNNFTGWIPKILSSSLLETIDISDNNLSGRIPRWMGNMLFLSKIIMPNNHFEGPIPAELCRIEYLVVLDLSMNNISGTLPSCFTSVVHVHLSKNRLRGPIPNKICKSSGLVTLDLSHNQLTGNIPNCIDNLSYFSYIILKHNNLEGEIPNQFCQLDKLSLIDLSHNNLSGHIPNCLKVNSFEERITDYAPSPESGTEMSGSINMTTKSMSYSYKGRILDYLSGIDLSSNKLTGEIPHEMGNFHKIRMLNLSHNSLVGSIPPSISNLTEIESLDLSYNNLSGSIPPEFIKLYTLAYFNVSYNNLSGKPPPRVAQFASDFDENSYWGNPFLCGEPLPKNCSTMPNQPTKDVEVEEDDGLMDIESFYVTFIVSYIMVLLCMATVIYINPHWRRVWFYLIERVITSCFYFIIDNLPTQSCCGNI